MTTARHDAWTCAHCGARFPVPSLARDHETTCPHRPQEQR